MRQLNLKMAPNQKQLSIKGFPNTWVAKLAAEQADSQMELEVLYRIGIIALEKATTRLTSVRDGLERFGAWWVKQEMLRYKLEKKAL